MHLHIGCFMDRGELFGFLGLWDKTTRTLGHWGDAASAELDLTTWEDTAEFTAEAVEDPASSPSPPTSPSGPYESSVKSLPLVS